MSVIEHIPTEIVQLLSAADAAAYRLVPCGRDGDLVRFYGSDTKDYTDASEELEVLYGWQTAVEPIAEEDLQRLLLRYCRGMPAPREPSRRRVARPRPIRDRVFYTRSSARRFAIAPATYISNATRIVAAYACASTAD